MFANPIKLAFGLHNKQGDLRVIRLGTSRIPFAGHLLSKKLKSSSNGTIIFEVFTKLREMTLQPCKFLGDVAAIGENRDFRRDTWIENIRGQSRGLQSAKKDLPLPLGHPRRECPHTPNESSHAGGAARKFLLKISAFADTHGKQPVKCGSKRPIDKRQKLASGHVVCLQDSGSGKHSFQRDHTTKVEFFLERTRLAQKLSGPPLVDENRRRF